MAQAPGTDISLMAIKAQIPVVSDLKVLQHLLVAKHQRQFFHVFDVVKKVARLKGTDVFSLGVERNPNSSSFSLSEKPRIKSK